MTVETVTRAVSGAGADRPDLLVHALAQLADDVTLDLPVRTPNRPLLELLARAYGIGDRVRFVRASEGLTIPPTETTGGLVDALARPDDPPAAIRAEGDGLLRGARVAVVTNILAPYRRPLFAQMAQRLETAGGSFRVFCLRERAPSRPWMSAEGGETFERECLTSLELPLGGERRPLVPLDLERRLDRFSPTILVVGGFSPAITLRGALWARRHGVAFGVWSGEHRAMRTAASAARHRVRRWIVDRADFAIAYGFAAGEYLLSLRGDLPVMYGRNTSPLAAPGRTRPDHPDVVELVTVGDLATSRKGVDVIVDAMRLVPELRCRLTVVGGGVLLHELRARASGDDRVRFLGAQPASRVRDVYAGADAFLFPSRADVFGLVFVEALGSGLATISATAPGAVADLGVHGRNCLLIEGHRAEDWAAAIERLVVDHELRSALGAGGRRTITGRWTIEHAADAMVAGLRLGVLAAGGRKR